MKALIIFLATFFHLTLFFAQAVHGQSFLSGKVTDGAGKSLSFANILLLNRNDSTLVKGVVSDEAGNYRIDDVNSGNYLLAATMVGFKMAYSAPIVISEVQTTFKAPLLSLSDDVKQLAEVTVEAARPFIEQKIDRTVVNVANSIIASGSTALEVLEKAPGVIIDRQNDAISLRGKEGVIVQIDGKQTYLSMADVVSLLRNTASDNIDNIELITNPSAKYDAAGNAGIINIRMKKNNNAGTNGSISIGGGAGRYDRERGSFQLNHRTSKLNIFANYSATRGGNYWAFEMARNQADGDQRNVIHQTSYLRFRQTGQNAKAGIDYFISNRTTIGLVWTAFWNNHQERGPAGAAFRRQESGPVYLQTSTAKTLSEISFNQIGNLNLVHNFANNGGILTTDFDLGYFSREYTNNLLTSTIIPDEYARAAEELVTQMPTTIKILTLKADYSRSLPGNFNMESGLKSSFVTSDNNMTLSTGFSGELELDPTLSNHFQYSENVNALYVSFSGKSFAKTEMQLGLRMEHTLSTGHSLSQDQKVKRNYLNIFPSLFLSKSLSEKQSLAFSYSYRIDRPNYHSLNPSRSYVDPYAFRRGNPFLKPQYTHAMEIKHGFDDKIFTSLGADYVNDLMFYILQTVDAQKAEYTPENIGKSQAYNLNISFPVNIIRGWTLQASMMGLYTRIQYAYKDIPLTLQQVSGRLNGNNSLLLGKGWTAELSGWINTPAVYGMFQAPWLGSVDAGIQKAFGAKWKAKLSFQDLLHTNRFIRNSEVPGFTQNMNISMDTRIAMLNLTYSFGNQQMNAMRQRKLGSEEEMKRTN